MTCLASLPRLPLRRAAQPLTATEMVSDDLLRSIARGDLSAATVAQEAMLRSEIAGELLAYRRAARLSDTHGEDS